MGEAVTEVTKVRAPVGVMGCDLHTGTSDLHTITAAVNTGIRAVVIGKVLITSVISHSPVINMLCHGD